MLGCIIGCAYTSFIAHKIRQILNGRHRNTRANVFTERQTASVFNRKIHKRGIIFFFLLCTDSSSEIPIPILIFYLNYPSASKWEFGFCDEGFFFKVDIFFLYAQGTFGCH